MAEREEVLAELDAARMCNQIEYAAYSRLHDLISELPEQKHGHWKGHSECLETLDDEHMACSVCGCVYNIYMNDAATFDYCPQCGAKMDEEAKQGE